MHRHSCTGGGLVPGVHVSQIRLYKFAATGATVSKQGAHVASRGAGLAVELHDDGARLRCRLRQVEGAGADGGVRQQRLVGHGRDLRCNRSLVSPECTWASLTAR
jgi:hypothetical protein